MVFQDSTLFPLAHRRRERRLRARGPGPARGKAAREAARERALAAAGLSDVADRYPGEPLQRLQRRVEILRALCNEPAVLLLDEPFRGWTPCPAALMHEALLEMYDRSGVTVLFITHDVEEAVFLGTHVSVMTTRPGASSPPSRSTSTVPAATTSSPVTGSVSRRCGVGRGARRGEAGFRGRRTGDDPMSTLALATEYEAPAHAVARSGSWWRCCSGELATRLDEWIGLAVPFVAALPSPTEVVADLGGADRLAGLLEQVWSLSLQRVALGSPCPAARWRPRPAHGHRAAGEADVPRPRDAARPIPPLAWVPLAIIFWPTQEGLHRLRHLPGCRSSRSSSTP